MSFYDGWQRRRREEAMLKQKAGPATLPPVEPRTLPLIGRSSSAGNVHSGDDFTNRRIEDLEARLSRTEQSNRGLLDEVMRLQSQLKGHMRANEDVLREITNSQSKFREDEVRKLKDEEKKRDESGSEMTRMEESFKKLKSENQRQMAAMHEQFKSDRARFNEKITRMNDAVNLIEGQLDEARKQIDKVLAAEIQTRKLQDKLVSEKVMDVHEKLRVGIATLQDSMTANGSKNDELSQLRTIIDDQIAQSKETLDQSVTDLDREMKDLKQKLNITERELDELRRAQSETAGNVAHALSAPVMPTTPGPAGQVGEGGDEVKYRLRKMTKRQEEMEQDVQNIKSVLGDPEQLKRDVAEAKLAADKVKEEETNRMRDTEDIRAQLQKAREAPGRGPDDASLSKLSEAITQCRTVLNDKIEKETKDRKADTKDYKSKIKDLGEKVKKLEKKK